MKTYKTEDGELIQGGFPEEIVMALKDGGRFTADQSVPEYMTGMAKRYKEWANADLRTDSAENFVLDLQRNGFLVEQPN